MSIGIAVMSLLVPMLSGAAQADGSRALMPPGPVDSWCASGPGIVEHVEQLHAWNERRRPAIAAMADHQYLEVDGIYFYEADEMFLPFRRKADLEGLTLSFIPDGDGYRLERIPLAYEENRGTLIHDDGLWSEAMVSTGGAPVGIGDQSSALLTVTSRHGIYFGDVLETSTNQFLGTDILGIEAAMASPLLVSSLPATWESPDLWVRGGDELVISWVNDRGTEFTYDVQAVFRSDGRVDFNYRSLGDANWGTVVFSGGDVATSLGMRHLFSASDPADAEPLDADLRGVTVEQAGSSEMLRIVVEMGAELDREIMSDDDYRWIVVAVENHTATVEVYLTKDASYLRVPGRGWREGTPSLDIDGNIITAWVDGDLLGEGSVTGVYSYKENEGRVDEIEGDMLGRLDRNVIRRFQRDLTAVSPGSVADHFVESFTLGDLDPMSIWKEVSARSSFDPDQVDGLAIYQNFFTDLILYAGAYSTVGNPQVSGVYGQNRRVNPADPASPALLHMNRLRYRHNENDARQGRVLAHELGHRWLYFFDIIENGEVSNSLNPLGAHPAQYVHIPAAFSVYGGNESSVMGGAYFTDNSDGTWTAPTELDSFGFSWHELYLMGLAAPEEVEPWYYLAETSPRLGDVYYPPAGITVEAERVDVHFDQLLEAMGPREPDHAKSKKQFQMLYVLLVDDLEALTQEDIDLMLRYRDNFRETFSRATGGRASVVGNEPKSRRRGIQR